MNACERANIDLGFFGLSHFAIAENSFEDIGHDYQEEDGVVEDDKGESSD